MDLVSLLKNVGSLLATVTTVIYLSGYLALRARAFTLGSDPAFALAYEGYVFAGFRFTFLSLLFLLVLSPVILLVRLFAFNVVNRLSAGWVTTLEWLLLALWAVAVIVATLWVFSLDGILLRSTSDYSKSLLGRAVVGGEMVELFTLAALFLTALSILWFRRHLSAIDDPFTWLLGVVVLLELFLLPILHGSLYADRKVRVLAATPSTVKGVGDPLGIIDRNSDHVTLLGLDENGQRRLVTIKLEDINGIPVTKIVPLKQFVENDLSHVKVVKEGNVHAEKNVVAESENAFKQLMTKLHLALQNLSSLGETVVEEGEIWSVELDSAGNPAKARPIGAAGNFSWPVFAIQQRAVYAIRQGRIYQLREDKESAVEIDKQKQWLKLLGVTDEGDILGMIRENNSNRLATLRPDGRLIVNAPPRNAKEQEWESSLIGENRVYAGDRALYVDRSTKGGRGFDVFSKSGEKVVNVSNCGDYRCGLPSLSPDFRRILYVRKPPF